MPYIEGQPTLTGILAWIPMKQIVKTAVFRGRYVRLYNFVEALPFQYESGAILGRARRDKQNVLEEMLIIPGATEGKIIKILQDEAKGRLEEFKNQNGKEPDTFGGFIFERELERITGLSFIDSFEAYKHGNKKILKVFDQKIPVEQAQDAMRLFGLAGIGFGSVFPELTERMCKNSAENIDMDKWSEARAYGLAIPEKPDIVSFEEREKALLQIVAAYTAEFYPELLDPLDLRGYLVEGRDEEMKYLNDC